MKCNENRFYSIIFKISILCLVLLIESSCTKKTKYSFEDLSFDTNHDTLIIKLGEKCFCKELMTIDELSGNFLFIIWAYQAKKFKELKILDQNFAIESKIKLNIQDMYDVLNEDKKSINRFFEKTPKCLNEFISNFDFSSNIELTRIIRKIEFRGSSEYISNYDTTWNIVENRYKRVLVSGCEFGINMLDQQISFQSFYDELFWITEAHLAKQENKRGHVFFIKIKDYEIFGCATHSEIYEYFIKNVSGKEVLVRRLRVF